VAQLASLAARAKRVRYRLCLLVFKAVHGTAPECLTELRRSNAEDTAHSRLRSAAHGDLRVPSSKTNFVIVRLQSAGQRHAEKREIDDSFNGPSVIQYETTAGQTKDVSVSTLYTCELTVPPLRVFERRASLSG